MNTHFHILPLDRTTIKTRLSIQPDLFDEPSAYIRKHALPIRTFKVSRGNSKRGPTRNLTLDVLTYKGIKAELKNVTGDPLTDVTIHFNPGVCLRAHNGSVLSLAEFLDAIGILVTHFKPFLINPDDWIDLVPGLRVGGVAYWSYLEIILQYPDPSGTLLAGFRNAQMKTTQTKIRHWPESIVIGGKRSDLQFGIYRKAVEMEAKGKLPSEQLANYRGILRLEVRLQGKKLVLHLGNERNVEEIDGVPRLVRFYPLDAVSGFRKAFGELQGVFHSSRPPEPLKPRKQLTPLGRLLARVSLDPRTSLTLQELLHHVRFYCGAKSKSELKTISEIRKAGITALESHSSISKDVLFSDAAFRTQPSVWSEKREKKVLHEADDAFVHPMIRKAYQPPSLSFQPITTLPEYLRV